MHEGERIALAVPSAVIGRVSSCEVQVSHPLVSRRHCRIDVTPDGVYAEDLGSSNGVVLNGSITRGNVAEAFRRGRRVTADTPRGKFDDGEGARGGPRRSRLAAATASAARSTTTV